MKNLLFQRALNGLILTNCSGSLISTSEIFYCTMCSSAIIVVKLLTAKYNRLKKAPHFSIQSTTQNNILMSSDKINKKQTNNSLRDQLKHNIEIQIIKLPQPLQHYLTFCTNPLSTLEDGEVKYTQNELHINFLGIVCADK